MERDSEHPIYKPMWMKQSHMQMLYQKGIATACHLLHLPSVNAEYLSIAFPRVGTNCWRITTGKSHVTPAYMSECIVGYMH